MALSRISITIPEELVARADRKAADLDRSRSWVIVDALRRYLETGEGLVRETAVAYVAGLGPSRMAQLEADLRLTPEERVIEAERTSRVVQMRRAGARPERILTFDSYENYVDWKRRDEAGA